MRRIILLSSLGLLVFSCRKDPVNPPSEPPPAICYVNLGDTAIRMNHSAKFDINGDGEWDLFFGTLLVGDPLNEIDKHQWLVGSSFNTNLPISSAEKIPVLQKDRTISVTGFEGYHWFNASMVYLAQKIVGFASPPFWEGDWKNASHQFIPFQVIRDGGRYHGWIEVSFDSVGEKLILHKAGISLLPEVQVKAGR